MIYLQTPHDFKRKEKTWINIASELMLKSEQKKRLHFDDVIELMTEESWHMQISFMSYRMNDNNLSRISVAFQQIFYGNFIISKLFGMNNVEKASNNKFSFIFLTSFNTLHMVKPLCVVVTSWINNKSFRNGFSLLTFSSSLVCGQVLCKVN